MEIYNVGKSNVELNRQLKSSKESSKAKSAKNTDASTSSASSEAGSADVSGVMGNQSLTRSQRIEQLKAQFQAGKPIDVQKLADKLVQSGLFFDKKA